MCRRSGGDGKMRAILDIKKQRGRSGLEKELKRIVRCAKKGLNVISTSLPGPSSVLANRFLV